MSGEALARRPEQLEASPMPTANASPGDDGDASFTPRGGASSGYRSDVCGWCRSPLEQTRPSTYCSKRCRQTAFRLRRRRATVERNATPMRVAYADPPYPGKARKYYAGEATYGGEVDHRALIASLGAGSYDGWALSTSAEALRDVLPLCPPAARVCAWVKPIGACPSTFGLHNTWEPLIVVPARRLRPGVRDWLSAQPARGGGELPGRKPIAFCAWLFDCLGMVEGDELVDLFPGTGIVGRAWAELSRRTSATSQEYSSDASFTPAVAT